MESIVIQQITKVDIEEAVRTALAEYLDLRESSEASHDEIGNVELAMAVTGLAKATIYTKVSNRQIPHMKRGKFLYFSRSELVSWLSEGRRKTRAEIAKDGFDLHRMGGK